MNFAGDNQMESVPTGLGQMKAFTLKDKINMAVTQAEQQLAQAKRAREIFDKNPELEELINIMNNSGIFRY